MVIYHNPRCKKSREALDLLKSHNKDPEIIEYLKTPPSKEDLKAILDKLGMKPEEIIRKSESVFKENYKGKDLSEDEWLEAIVEYPKLLERPIVLDGNKAVLGRPPEKVEELL